MGSSYGHGCVAQSAPGGVAGYLRHSSYVDTGHWENPACAGADGVPLVASDPLRHAPWADDFSDPVRHAPFSDRFRLPRPQAIDSDGGGRNPLPGARATLRGRILSGNDGGPPITRHRGGHLDDTG